MKLSWSLASIEDRQSIFRHVSAASHRAALALDDRFEEQAELLLEHPEMGRPGRRDRTREFLAHRNYFLIYSLSPGEVHVLRVLHTSRQWPPSEE